MNEMRFRYGIPSMCGFLKVSKSGYYKWLHQGVSKRAGEEGRLEGGRERRVVLKGYSMILKNTGWR